jgi:hypothetical protein
MHFLCNKILIIEVPQLQKLKITIKAINKSKAEICICKDIIFFLIEWDLNIWTCFLLESTLNVGR